MDEKAILSPVDTTPEYPTPEYPTPESPIPAYTTPSSMDVKYHKPQILFEESHGHEKQISSHHVPDYMILSIFTCLCCFWPLGLLAISQARKARKYLKSGDTWSAMKESKRARNTAIGSILLGILILPFCIYYTIRRYNAISKRFS